MKFPLFLPIIFLPTAVTQNDIIVSKRQIQQKTNPVQTTISQASINGSIIPLFTNQINSLVSTEENSLRMPTMPTMPKINNINPLVQKTNPISSTQNIFVKFSKINIKKLAEEGKIVAIQKIILIIVNLPSVKCETKVQYLLNIEGSIKAAINRKQLLFQEMKGLNEATVQVWRLQQLIKNLNKSKQGLNISHHQSNMINLLSQQTFLKNKIYQLKTQLESEQARVTKYMIEIEILSIQNTQKQNIINNRSLLLIQTNNQIQQIERKLKLAKQLQSDLVQGIIKSKDLVLKNNIQIQNLRQLIGATQFRIITLQNILDNLTKDAKVLEVDVFRSRLDLSNARLDSKIFQQQIKNFKAKISFQQIYLVDGDLQEICDQLTSLNQSLSYIQSQIDRQYYYCYGAGQINMISKGKATLYIMQVRDFRKYIYNAYQQNIDIPQLRTNQNQYQLQTIEHQTGIIHENRFLCSQGNLFETGMGIIIFKDVQYLVVLDSIQKKIKLSIRYCSRIEAATQAPQIGQKIAWKGQKFNAESYDLISATSWW